MAEVTNRILNGKETDDQYGQQYKQNIGELYIYRIGIDHKGTGRIATSQRNKTKFLLYKT